MSEPGSGLPANADDDWPHVPPERLPIYVDPGDGAADEAARPHAEWSHDGVLPGEPVAWGSSQELEPPPGWATGGTFVPGNGDRPPWDELDRDQPAAGHGGRGAAGAGRASASAQPGAGQPPAISKANAENVVADYSKVNNKANAAYSDSLLSMIESGSSYTMDVGAYRFALGQSGRAAYVPFQLTDTAYHIPRLSKGSYPRWFAVKGTYATVADGKNLGPACLVFAQDSAVAPWKDVIEPDILPGQTLPQIATDSSGYAQSVAPDAAGLNVAPGEIGHVTAEWLGQVASNRSDSVVKDESGNITDLRDEVFWRSGNGGTAMDATDAHSAPAGQVFALRTTSGGALAFYATAARLTLTLSSGDAIGGLNIPGYYSPANSAG